MAIVVVDDGTVNTVSNSTSFSELSYTTNGSMLIVGLAWRETVLSAGGLTFDTMTYNGIDMTRVISALNGGVNNEIWVLPLAPGLTTGDIVGTWGGDTATGRASAVWHIMYIRGSCQDITGIQNATSATGTSTTPSVTVTTNWADSLIVDALGVNSASFGGDAVITPQDTEWSGGSGGVGGDAVRVQSDDQYQTSAVGTVTMNYTLDSSRAWSVCACEILAATPCDVIQIGQTIPQER